MQKLNYVIPLLALSGALIILPVSAEQPTTALPQVVAPDVTAEAPLPESSQQQIIGLMQQDFEFQSEYRNLKNSLALEELRSKIRKLQGEGKPAVVPVAPMAIEQMPAQSAADAMPLPRVLLETQVAGVSTVAVSDGMQVRYVSPGRKFDMNGKQYRLHRSQSGVFDVREVTQ